MSNAAILEEKTIDSVFCIFWLSRTLSIVLSALVYFGRAGTNSSGGSDQLLEIKDRVVDEEGGEEEKRGFYIHLFLQSYSWHIKSIPGTLMPV